MNPNEVQQLIPTAVGTPGLGGLNSAPQTAKKKIIIVISIIMSVIVIVLILNFFHIISFSKFFKPKSISKTVPVTRIIVRGVLTTIKGTDITVDAYGKPHSFSVAGTRNLQRVISGNIGENGTKVSLASLSELKVGQEVLIIADRGSSQAKTVYILRQ